MRKIGSVALTRAEISRRWRKAHPDRVKELRQRWEKANPEKSAKQRREARRRWRKAHPEYYAAYYRRQRGIPEATRPKPVFCERGCGRLAKDRDHDHRTGKFRGWLCGSCNRALGLLGDTVQSAEETLDYLRRNS